MIKSTLKKIPLLTKIFHFVKFLIQRNKIKKILDLKNNEKKFIKIYKTNFWGDRESISGPGSNIKNTKETIHLLKKIIKKYNVKKILDAPCGDFIWMYKVLNKMPYLKYIGIDIVNDLIEYNNKQYGKPNIKFYKKDILNNLFPKCDLIICRDFLIHLSNKDIKKFLKNLKSSNFKFLLINGYEAKSKRIINKEIVTGDFRELDIFKYPVNISKKYLFKYEDHKFQNTKTNYKSYLYLFEKKNIF